MRLSLPNPRAGLSSGRAARGRCLAPPLAQPLAAKTQQLQRPAALVPQVGWPVSGDAEPGINVARDIALADCVSYGNAAVRRDMVLSRAGGRLARPPRRAW